MKKIVPFLLAAALLPPAALSAAGFEGKVAMKMTSPDGKTQQINLSVKDTLTRMEMPAGRAGGGAMIMDSAKRQMTILMTEQHMYMVQPLPDPASMAAAGGPAGQPPAGAAPTLEKSGAGEKILGYDTVKFVAKDKEGTSEIWVTDQLGTFSFLGMSGAGPGGPPMRGGPRGGGGAPAAQGWEQMLQGKAMFPLRVITTAANGKITRMDIVSIEKQTQPEADFTIPADYRDLSSMMQGMGMPPGMRPPGGG